MTDESYQRVMSEIESMTAEDIEKLSKKLTEEMKLYTPNPWHTGTPTEEGDYLVAFRMSDNSVEYGWCNWNNGAWDILCDYDPDTYTIVAWMPIPPYEEN